MLPRPSRLKSLASEFSPVLTTPPPVEPNTVLVLMSVPEMMLSSNLVALRRRAAISAARPASTATAPAPIAHSGVLAKMSSKNPAGAFGGALAAGTGSTFGAAGAGAGVAVAGGADLDGSAAGGGAFAGCAGSATGGATASSGPLALPTSGAATPPGTPPLFSRSCRSRTIFSSAAMRSPLSLASFCAAARSSLTRVRGVDWTTTRSSPFAAAGVDSVTEAPMRPAVARLPAPSAAGTVPATRLR